MTSLDEPLYGTIPAASKRFDLPVKLLRAAVNRGDLPAYAPPGTRRRRVRFTEVEAWLRGGVVTVPTAHARARLAEVIAEEAGRGR